MDSRPIRSRRSPSTPSLHTYEWTFPIANSTLKGLASLYPTRHACSDRYLRHPADGKPRLDRHAGIAVLPLVGNRAQRPQAEYDGTTLTRFAAVGRAQCGVDPMYVVLAFHATVPLPSCSATSRTGRVPDQDRSRLHQIGGHPGDERRRKPSSIRFQRSLPDPFGKSPPGLQLSSGTCSGGLSPVPRVRSASRGRRPRR